MSFDDLQKMVNWMEELSKKAPEDSNQDGLVSDGSSEPMTDLDFESEQPSAIFTMDPYKDL